MKKLCDRVEHPGAGTQYPARLVTNICSTCKNHLLRYAEEGTHAISTAKPFAEDVLQ